MSVKGFKFGNGAVQKYDYNELDNKLELDTALETPERAADSKAVGDVLKADIAPEYSASSTYAVGDYVLYHTVLYRCTTAITTAEAWTAAHWTAVNVGGEITAIKTDLLQKADANGTSENLTAGNAEQMLTDKGITDKVPYLLRASGGNGADREEDTIIGGTVAWNQLLNTNNVLTEQTSSDVTFTLNNNYSYNITGTATGRVQTSQNVFDRFNIINGHKYAILIDKAISPLRLRFATGLLQTNFTVSTIASCNADTNAYVSFDSGGAITATFNISNLYIMCVDLTQMFGTAIADRAYAMEQSTAGSGIAWLKSMGFFRESYYPYDAGTLKSVEGLTAHSMVGFNQWDEEWEVGAINPETGENIPDATKIRSKNYIPVIPGTIYYWTGARVLYVEYDANKNYLRYGNLGNYIGPNFSFTPSSDAYYIRFNGVSAYGATYKGDICINISSSRNGEYEPYKTRSYPLDSDLTLRGTLKLDENYQVYYDGDEYASDGTVKRNFKTKVLNGGSSETWLLHTGSGVNQFYTWVNDVVHVANTVNVVSDKYSSIPIEQRANNYGTCYTGEGAICFNISSSVASTVEAWLALIASNPITVVYRTTPTTEEADPFQNPQIVDPYGTEEYETTGIVPVGHETFYPENLRAKIEGLPFNFATLIAPTESTYKATRAYSANNLFIVDNILYKATASISNGGTITPGTNCTATTLAEVIAAL